MKHMLFLVGILAGLSFTSTAQSRENIRSVLDTSLYSQHLAYEKEIQLHVPISLDTTQDRRYPLIVIFDMQNAINYEYLLHTIDYLSAFGQIPECMIVGVKAGERSGRYLETQLLENEPKARGEVHEQFLFQELIPYLQDSWKASDQVILIGHSRFGFYTSYLLSRHMNELLGVVSVSPFFRQRTTNLITALRDSAQAYTGDTRVYYRIAVGDTITDTPEYYEMIDSLQQAELSTAFDYAGYAFPTADHIVMPGLTSSRALYDIFAYWNETQMQFHRRAAEGVEPAYREGQALIRKVYGAEIPYSLGVMNGTGWRYFQEGYYASAISCWELMMKDYPGFAEGWYFIGSAHAELGNSAVADDFSEKALTTLQHSSFYTDEEKRQLAREIRDRQ